MFRLILALIVIGITIYAVIDCLRTDNADVQIMPKPLWLLVIIVPPWIGGLFWIWLGVQNQGPGDGGRRFEPRTIPPDDDPEFLRSLNKRRKPPSGPAEPV